jgi:hypothetical protein
MGAMGLYISWGFIWGVYIMGVHMGVMAWIKLFCLLTAADPLKGDNIMSSYHASYPLTVAAYAFHHSCFIATAYREPWGA